MVRRELSTNDKPVKADVNSHLSFIDIPLLPENFVAMNSLDAGIELTQRFSDLRLKTRLRL
jgi:hypothetical protein